MIVLSALALAGNIVSLVVLHRVRSGEAHLQASWIFTANDIKVNGLVIAAAIGVAITDSAIPDLVAGGIIFVVVRSEEHTSELQSLMRISYAVFCLKKKKKEKD